MRCQLCGHGFTPTPACHAGCPMGSRCTLICCPNCGYQVVDESKSGLAKALRRVLRPRDAEVGPGGGTGRRDEDAVPLTHVRTGTPVEVHGLEDMPAARASRLTAFGLAPGTPVAILQRKPVPVVQIGETELALSEDILAQILVRPPRS